MSYSRLSEAEVLQACDRPDGLITLPDENPYPPFRYVFKSIRFLDSESAIFVTGNCQNASASRLSGRILVQAALRIPSVTELLQDGSWRKVDERLIWRILDKLVDKIGVVFAPDWSSIPALRHYVKSNLNSNSIDRSLIPGDRVFIALVNDLKGTFIALLSSLKYRDWLNREVGPKNIQRFLGRLRASIPEDASKTVTDGDLVSGLDEACNQFAELLDTDPPEEEVQKWLIQRNHWIFIDLDAQEVRSKVAFGRFVSDFVVRRSTGIYNLIEIEKPGMPLFRSSDSHPTHQLTHAMGQIVDWQRYIRMNLQTVRHELDLQEIYEPEGTLIAGRSSAIEGRDATERWNDLRLSKSPAVFTFDESIGRVRSLIENLRVFLKDAPASE